MTIPSYRVMNWTEYGVRERDVKGRGCAVRSRDANTDGSNAEDWERAMRVCAREPCICRGDPVARTAGLTDD